MSLESDAQKLKTLYDLSININSMFERIMDDHPLYRNIEDFLDDIRQHYPAPWKLFSRLINSFPEKNKTRLQLEFLENDYKNLEKNDCLSRLEMIAQDYKSTPHYHEKIDSTFKQLSEAIKNIQIQTIERKMSDIMQSWIKLNYWGYTMKPFDVSSVNFYSLSCLKCSIVMTDFSEFLKKGPKPDTHQFFCNNCLCQIDQQLKEIYRLCDELKISSEPYIRIANSKLDRFNMDFKSLLIKDVDKIRKVSSGSKRSQTDAEKIWIFY